jgi:DNA primase
VPYSLRGRNPIGVSMPITGAELDSIATGTDLSFGLKDTELRLLATGDTYINGLRRI